MSISKVYVQLNNHVVTFMTFPNVNTDVVYIDNNKHNSIDARRIYNEYLAQGYTLTKKEPVKVRTRPIMSPMEIYNHGKCLFNK